MRIPPLCKALMPLETSIRIIQPICASARSEHTKSNQQNGYPSCTLQAPLQAAPASADLFLLNAFKGPCRLLCTTTRMLSLPHKIQIQRRLHIFPDIINRPVAATTSEPLSIFGSLRACCMDFVHFPIEQKRAAGLPYPAAQLEGILKDFCRPESRYCVCYALSVAFGFFLGATLLHACITSARAITP